MMGLACSLNGRWSDAEKLEVQVMETRKMKLGVDHPSTLTSMNNLAFTWKGNGKEIEAVRLMEDCVRVRKRVLGVNHPHSISSCTVKAEIERAMKDFTEVVGAHDLRIQAYQGYGKGLIKKFKCSPDCSPDANVQMVIQLACFKMYGKNRPTYELAAMRRFQ